MPDMSSTMKSKILKLLDDGVKDYEFIAKDVGCSVRYVYEVARKRGEGSMNMLPAPLEQDLSLVEELAADFDGKNNFAAGVRWLGKSLMFTSRLLGQISAIPTMGRAGELQEMIALAQAMTPKPTATDPALVASLNNVSAQMARANAPKTPEGMMMETMMPVLQRTIQTLMGQFGGGQVATPGQSGKATLPPGWTDKTEGRG